MYVLHTLLYIFGWMLVIHKLQAMSRGVLAYRARPFLLFVYNLYVTCYYNNCNVFIHGNYVHPVLLRAGYVVPFLIKPDVRSGKQPAHITYYTKCTYDLLHGSRST